MKEKEYLPDWLQLRFELFDDPNLESPLTLEDFLLILRHEYTDISDSMRDGPDIDGELADLDNVGNQITIVETAIIAEKTQFLKEKL